jgi:Phage head-tail joining protein.
MNAGELRYTLDFLTLVKSQNNTGEETKSYQKAFSCKAAKLKSNTIVIKSDVNAKELFDDTNLVFVVRNYPQIKDDCRVVYDGTTYHIKLLERMVEDNSIKLTLEKLNL